jgi:hypothetical protein
MRCIYATIDVWLQPTTQVISRLPSLPTTSSRVLMSLPSRKQNRKKIPMFYFGRHCIIVAVIAVLLSVWRRDGLNPVYVVATKSSLRRGNEVVG